MVNILVAFCMYRYILVIIRFVAVYCESCLPECNSVIILLIQGCG